MMTHTAFELSRAGLAPGATITPELLEAVGKVMETRDAQAQQYAELAVSQQELIDGIRHEIGKIADKMHRISNPWGQSAEPQAEARLRLVPKEAKSETPGGHPTDYLTYEPENEMVYVRLMEDGTLDLSIYLASEMVCSDEDEIEQAVVAWALGKDSVIIAPRFKVSSPVDYLVEGHQMPAYGGRIDAKAKPVLDALRAEMLAQVARIDGLEYKEVGEEP